MNVLMTGATGVLGSHLINYLKEKYTLTLLRHIKEPSEKHGCKWVCADLVHETKLSSLLEKIDCVIHLAGITHANNVRRYFEVNEAGTMNLVKACELKNVKHFIFISTRAIDPNGGAYSQSKFAAEKIVQNSKLNWTIIRPSEVYGGNTTEIISRMIYLIEKFNLALIPGDCSAKLAPLFIGDFVQFILQSILNDKVFKKVYTLVGPMEYTLSEFADSVALYLNNKRKPIKIKIPLKLISCFLELNGKLKLFGNLSRDQIDRLLIIKSSDYSLASKDLGFNPINLQEGMKMSCVRFN